MLCDNGFAQVHDMGTYGGWIDMATYRRAEAAGHLPIRIYSFVAISGWAKLDSFVKIPTGGVMMVLRWGGIEGFVDGFYSDLPRLPGFINAYLDAPEVHRPAGYRLRFSLRKWVLSAGFPPDYRLPAMLSGIMPMTGF